MVKTPSVMLPLSTAAPDFDLPDTLSGQQKSLSALKSQHATVVMFICNHCPFVVHVIDKLVEVVNQHQPQGVSFVAISSNDIVDYPQDGPDKMKFFAKTHKFTFPYLYDETQAIAKAYQATCTPDFFVLDGKLTLQYRGQFDDSRPGNGIEVSGRDLSAAIDAIVKGDTVNPQQKPSIGCNIKWKS